MYGLYLFSMNSLYILAVGPRLLYPAPFRDRDKYLDSSKVWLISSGPIVATQRAILYPGMSDVNGHGFGVLFPKGKTPVRVRRRLS